MSQVQTLTYVAQEHTCPTRTTERHSVADQSAWPTDTSVEGFPTIPPYAYPTENSALDKASPASAEHMFPSLPPLLHGHPDVHLREGVIESNRLASLGKPDSERAFFVADLSQVYSQHQRWVRCFPDIKPYYAVKCNPDPYVLRLLASLGAGFDCASNGEINQVLRIGGVDPSRIIFANPCKAISFVRSAAKSGVDMMTFDNADELHKIARSHPRSKLIIRILTDDSKSLCRLGIKFGAPLNTVPGLLARAKELKLDVIGVSFHVGSGCYDSTVFTDAIMRSRHVFDIAEGLGFSFNLLDVGGGFEDGTFENTARILNIAIDEYFPNRRQLNIIAEPGRFYVSRAFSLAASVIARRAPMPSTELDAPTGDQQEGPNVMYYINEGVYGAFNCIMFDHQVVHPQVLSLNESFHVPSTEVYQGSSVWGPTCDSIDCVCPVTKLPASLQVGDWLSFQNMGAYTICAASQFNGFEASNVVYTSGEAGQISTETRCALASFAAKLSTGSM